MIICFASEELESAGIRNNQLFKVVYCGNVLLFTERFAVYRKELSLVRENQFGETYFPGYFYWRIMQQPLNKKANYSTDYESYHHPTVSKSDFQNIYIGEINYMKDKLDLAFKWRESSLDRANFLFDCQFLTIIT